MGGRAQGGVAGEIFTHPKEVVRLPLVTRYRIGVYV